MINTLSLILAVIIFLTSRPSLLGQNYAFISIFLSILLILIHVLNSSVVKGDLLHYNLISIALCSFLAISSLLGDGDISVAIKTVISFVLPFCAISLFLCVHNNAKFFLYVLSFLTALVGFSSLITFLISVGLGNKGIQLYQFSINGYANAGIVYLPFTLSSGELSVIDQVVLRTSGYMREPGIFQAFTIFFFFMNELIYKKILFRVGCFLALIFTFSTTGYVLFIVSLSCYLYSKFKNKVLGGVVLMCSGICSLMLFFFLPGIGYYDKLRTHGASIYERQNAVTQSFLTFSDNPFGVGYLSDIGNSMGNINALASIGQIGIIGFVLILILFLYPLLQVSKPYRIHWFIALSPLFLTTLLAQPLYDNPGTYFCMMLWMAVSGKGVGPNKLILKQ